METITSDGLEISSSSETPEQMQLALGEPEVAVEAAPAQEPEKTGETPEKTGEISPEEPKLTKEQRHSAPERVKRATAEAAAAKREAEDARKQAVSLQERLARFEAQQPSKEDDPEPTEEQFEAYKDYVKAQSRWEARQELKAFNAAQAEMQRRVVINGQMDQAKQAFSGRIKEAGGQEFLDKLSEDVLNIAADTPVGVAVRDSEMAPKLMQYLSDHPDELRALSGLHPAHIFRAIGKIEGKLEGVAVTGNAPRVVAVSRAKPPVKPVTGMPAVGNELSEDTPFEEFVARRRASMNAHSRN
jgi:hypothetical protein